MRDNVVIFLVSLVLVGCLAWLMIRANGINPVEASPSVPQAVDERPLSGRNTGDIAAPKPVDVNADSEDAKESPENPAVVLRARPAIEQTFARLNPVAPPLPVPAPPLAALPQIRPGSEKSHVTELFGDPNLSATTGDHGHTFDTFVYKRDRSSDELTIIRFLDGRVSSARIAP